MAPVQLAQHREGSGLPTLLLLHGFTGGGAEMLEAARELPGAHLALDLPGHADSGEARASFEETVEAIAANLGDEPIDVWGYSLGGRLALALAVRAATRVRRLVLESASPGLRADEPAGARLDLDVARARFLRQRGVPAFIEQWEREPLFASEQRLPEETRAHHRRTRLAHGAEGLAAAVVDLSPANQRPLWDALPSLQVPTLLVTGALDAKYCELARQMSLRLPGSRHISIAGAGHAPHRERPRETSAAIATFLAGEKP